MSAAPRAGARTPEPPTGARSPEPPAQDGAGAGPAASRTEVFAAMGGDVRLTVVGPGPGAQDALAAARAAVEQVEAACTRFRPSPLTDANADPDAWHRVPATLATAVLEARRAYEATGGAFDPRVLDVLLAWGHDEALAGGPAAVPAPRWPATLLPSGVRLAPADRPWQPVVRQDADGWHLHLDGQPIDLGGIGKGLAVRAAAAALRDAGRGALVDAGGDLVVVGDGPAGDWRVGVEDGPAGDWRVGVEDPSGADAPLLVLGLRDTACATSSVHRHSWLAQGRPVHHLVDPRTGGPGGDGLAAVTVLGPDPAWAEVWSKSLFLAGAAHVRAAADDARLAAAWVGRDGAVGMTESFAEHVTWRNDD